MSVCEDEGDIIGIGASAEPGNEWRFKYQDAKFTKGIGEREGGEVENVGRELWREDGKGQEREEGRLGVTAKEEGSKEGEAGGEERRGRGGKRGRVEGGEEGWEEVGGGGEGEDRNQGRKDADTARPGGALQSGLPEKIPEVANTFQAAGRERRACRYFWRGAQLGWRGPEAAQRLGWLGRT